MQAIVKINNRSPCQPDTHSPAHRSAVAQRVRMATKRSRATSDRMRKEVEPREKEK